MLAFVGGIVLGTLLSLPVQKLILVAIFAVGAFVFASRKNSLYLIVLALLLIGFFRGYFSSSYNKVLREPNPAQVWITNNLIKSFGNPEAYLASALISGDKKNLPWAIKNNFRDAGLSHLLAVSGYNVALIVSAISGLIKGRVGKKLEFVIIASVVISFVLLAGAKAPVIRAGIMGSLAALALKSGRASSGKRALLLAVTVMLAINPTLLVFDIGFELSVAATASILLLGPHLRKKLQRLTDFAGLRTNLATALAANVGVLPLVTIVFLKLPLYALLSNLLVVPFIPPIMLFSFMSALLGGHLIGAVIGFVGASLVGVVLNITRSIAHFPLASISVNNNVGVFLAGEALVGGSIIWWLYWSSKKKPKNLLS